MTSPMPADTSGKLRILFCGTPSFAVPSLQHLLAQPDLAIAAVITQPDRPRGRGHEVSYSPVKEIALDANLPVFQPEKIRTLESEQFLRDANADAIVIIAYGQIIPARMLNIPRLGWINLHASLLPKYRGAAPIQWAIANGESVTGVTSMRIDAGMDTGDTLLQRETPIGPAETTPQLAERLAQLGAPLMAETLRGLRDGTLRAKPQNHSSATTAPLLKKEDGLIDWSKPSPVIYNRMRGFSPWPGAYSRFRGTICHLSGSPYDSVRGSTDPTVHQPSVPGAILYDGKHLRVSCGQQSLLGITRVKLEGRKAVSAADFANGAHVRPGEQFS
ncbi:MAG TPA: methionyl-tRNA formyltransferase [Candidatus Acidoferrum sp.]|nr:methionyl-tRNA formyltransferase [Candidatus Acidoferrum sp.]